jgi:hypothetical protein
MHKYAAFQPLAFANIFVAPHFPATTENIKKPSPCGKEAVSLPRSSLVSCTFGEKVIILQGEKDKRQENKRIRK